MAGPFALVGPTREEVGGFVASLGEPAYRAAQILRWVYRDGATTFAEMTNLPKATRAALAERACLMTSHVVEVLQSSDGTEKLLVGLADGHRVETVIIPAGERRTVCVSSQVGCAVGCAFCASGLGGLVRSLSAGEIVEQALHARRRVGPAGASMNLVVMGIGEPLANYAALVAALRVVTAAWGLAMSGRRITVSTVGLPGRIGQLASEGLGVNLAVSVHAGTEATRARLVPGGRPLREVAEAAAEFLRATGREVTFEYVLIDGENDSAAEARAVARLVGRLPILVNLLPVNPVAELPWAPPSARRVERFAATLRGLGVRVQVRRRRGGDIDAACGQLRRRSGGG